MAPPTGGSEHFSDEELAEIKATFPKIDRVHALIHRLECAEAVIKAQCLCEHQSKDGICESPEAKIWKKSAGRE